MRDETNIECAALAVVMWEIVVIRPPRERPLRVTLSAPMHYDAHQPVINELEARILTLRDSL